MRIGRNQLQEKTREALNREKDEWRDYQSRMRRQRNEMRRANQMSGGEMATVFVVLVSAATFLCAVIFGLIVW